MFRAGLYARVSTNDRRLCPCRVAPWEYAAGRGWTITVQIREVGSGAAKRQAREELLEPPAAERSMSRWCGGWTAGVGNGSTGHPPGTRASGRRVRFLDRGTGSDHARRTRRRGCLLSSPHSNGANSTEPLDLLGMLQAESLAAFTLLLITRSATPTRAAFGDSTRRRPCPAFPEPGHAERPHGHLVPCPPTRSAARPLRSSA